MEKKMQVRVTYRERLNSWGEYIVRKVTIRAKGYEAWIYEDPERLNVLDCVKDYVSEMNFPPCEVEVVHGKYSDGSPIIEGHFHYMGKLVLNCNYLPNEEPDEDGIPVDLSGTLLGRGL